MSMTASVLQLDRRASQALRISDPYSLHRVVYSLYEDIRDEEAKNSSQTSGILFADQGGTFDCRRVLLLANREPASCVEGQYGQVESKLVPDSFLDFEKYRFKVIVNPTRRDSKSRKLIPVKGRSELGMWFCERAEKSWGFRVLPHQIQVNAVRVLNFKGKKGRDVTIAQAHVQGSLEVIDREIFRKSFNQGIGRARAFGCGLLQIQPLVQSNS